MKEAAFTSAHSGDKRGPKHRLFLFNTIQLTGAGSLPLLPFTFQQAKDKVGCQRNLAPLSKQAILCYVFHPTVPEGSWMTLAL